MRIPSFGGPVARASILSLPRTPAGSAPGAVNDEVRSALDILGALTDADPRKALRALRVRRRIQEHEKRDPGLLALLDKAVLLLETTGSPDG